MTSLYESKWVIALAASVGATYTFQKEYKVSATRPGRVLHALRPAVLTAPMYGTAYTGGALIYTGVKEGDAIKALLGASLASAAMAISDGHRIKVSRASRASALYLAGVALGAGYCLLHEQFDEQTKDSDANNTP